MTQRYLAISLFFTFLATSLLAQPRYSPFDLYPPLKGELNLSGAFGEVRTNTIHGGIDFRTGGKTGLPVYASNDGFISRVRVNGLVFGKAIYIDHPNGLTTVYGHLEKFTPQVEAFVKEQQYKRESFEIDMYLTPKDFPVKRAQVIGYSGNTGLSFGPHLHYEVRSTPQQLPLNPAYSNLKIIDTLSPIIYGAKIYNFDSSLFTTINSNITLNVQKQGKFYAVQDTIDIQGIAVLGVKSYDFVNQNSLTCGVNNIRMYVNNSLTYHYCLDEYNFADSRYINSHIDYALRQKEGKRFHRLFREPGNKLPAYKTLINNGLISTIPDSIYNIRIIIEDPYKNSAELKLVLRGKPISQELMTPNPFDSTKTNPYWLFFQENSFKSEWFSIDAPKDILYNSVFFSHQISKPEKGMYSPIIRVHNPLVPIHKAYNLKIKADSVPEKMRGKALIGSLNSSGGIVGVGGEYIDGTISAQINYFGNFFIILDTAAPTITPLNISNNKDMTKENVMKFKVSDNLSGISSIRGLINNKWALFEHDPKNNLVFYEIDSKRIPKGQTHSLLLIVTDKKGNKSEYKCFFLW
jgi:murein DD-endopeptidase MepM/ murein hydrolase activator NlpD